MANVGGSGEYCKMGVTDATWRQKGTITLMPYKKALVNYMLTFAAISAV